MLDLDLELDIIYAHIDELLCSGKMSEIDLILYQVDVDIPLVLLLGFLSTTFLCGAELQHRKRIVSIIKEKYPDRVASGFDVLFSGGSVE